MVFVTVPVSGQLGFGGLSWRAACDGWIRATPALSLLRDTWYAGYGAGGGLQRYCQCGLHVKEHGL